MKNHHLRVIILLGTFLLVCLLAVQLYWFNKAFDVAEKQFDHSVQVALRKVTDSVAQGATVQKLSSNFFFAATESDLNEATLDSLLQREFLLRDLDIDYELGVYNAEDDTLVYGIYVESTRHLRDETSFAGTKGHATKNFAVYFPKKRGYLAAELDIWIFSTAVLLLMFGFFAYAIASLLRERRFSELKNDFINNMTHEFKTPVTNIDIAGQILKQKATRENQIYVDILLKENAKLRQKIDGVLHGATSHMLRPVFQALDVHQLIRDCAEAFQLKVHERNGEIQLALHAKGSVILGDRELLTQAINNVIDNAEKYSPSAPRIVVRTQDTPNGIEVHVIDQGIGIAPEMTGKVFDKFFRIQSGNVHNVKGFGLGLSFVQDVIRSHKGRIRLLSETDKGTHVSIILPNT